MTAVDLLTIGVVFLIGVITGAILLVSLASLREDRRAKLSREAPDRVTHAGRLLTGLYVRRPGDDSNRRELSDHDQPAEFSGPLRPVSRYSRYAAQAPAPRDGEPTPGQAPRT